MSETNKYRKRMRIGPPVSYTTTKTQASKRGRGKLANNSASDHGTTTYSPDLRHRLVDAPMASKVITHRMSTHKMSIQTVPGACKAILILTSQTLHLGLIVLSQLPGTLEIIGAMNKKGVGC